MGSHYIVIITRTVLYILLYGVTLYCYHYTYCTIYTTVCGHIILLSLHLLYYIYYCMGSHYIVIITRTVLYILLYVVTVKILSLI